MTHLRIRAAAVLGFGALSLTAAGLPAVAQAAPAPTRVVAAAPSAVAIGSHEVVAPSFVGRVNGIAPRYVATVATGPRVWTGRTLRHPNGRAFSPQVTRWAFLALAVMREHRIPRKYLRGVLAQIQQESSGNPNAVNLWDINAQRGYPSKGLLQIIAPTYQAYAKPGFRSTAYQTVPYTNLWASMHYVLHAYGMGKFARWSSGYNQGY